MCALFSLKEPSRSLLAFRTLTLWASQARLVNKVLEGGHLLQIHMQNFIDYYYLSIFSGGNICRYHRKLLQNSRLCYLFRLCLMSDNISKFLKEMCLAFQENQKKVTSRVNYHFKKVVRLCTENVFPWMIDNPEVSGTCS